MIIMNYMTSDKCNREKLYIKTYRIKKNRMIDDGILQFKKIEN